MTIRFFPEYLCSRSLVEEAMNVVGRYYENTDRVAAYRLFRSARTRDDLRQMIDGDLPVSTVQSQQLRFEFRGSPTPKISKRGLDRRRDT
jgi:hypothetical protein